MDIQSTKKGCLWTGLFPIPRRACWTKSARSCESNIIRFAPGAVEVAAFLTDLAVRGQVAASTQNQALNALVFLYREVLGMELGDLGEFLRAKAPVRLPGVLTVEEVQCLLAALAGTCQLMGRLLYGTGMRLMELIRLRVKDVDFGQNQIIVHSGGTS
jgi:integrase